MDISINVKDAQPVPAAIPGVLIRVFSALGELETQGSTNVEGQVIFNLDAGEYTLRASKTRVGFNSPFAITVDPEEINSWTVTGTLLSLPSAPDPLYCRVYDYFIRGDGVPLLGEIVFTVRSAFQDTSNEEHVAFPGDPSIVGGALILPERPLPICSDSSLGLGWVDLPRESWYRCMLPGDPQSWILFYVPNAAGAALSDLLYPYPAAATTDPDPVSVAAGAEIEVALVLTLSNARLPEDLGMLAPATSDEAVATVRVGVGKTLIVLGVAVGEATITLAPQVGQTARRIPSPAYPTFLVTVT